MNTPETKWCSGYLGQWACSDKYPDHWVPVGEFGPSGDGLWNACTGCKDLANASTNRKRPRHPETNQLKVDWKTARASHYYGASQPKNKKSNPVGPSGLSWKECWAMANEDAKSIPWVTPGDDGESLSQVPITVAITEHSSTAPFPATDPEPIKEDFGPSTPMTKRTGGEVEGEKTPKGWVYVIRNPDNPKHLKIGKTFPNGMAKIMSDARRFQRAELVYKGWAECAEYAEQKIAHAELNDYRLRNLGYTDVGTEVFEVTPERAIEVVKMACETVNHPEFKEAANET